MGSRTREKDIFQLWRMIVFYNMAIMNVVNSSFIIAEDLYTINANTPPFTLSVYYTNDMNSTTSLTCKTVDSYSGLTAPSKELPVGSNQKTSVEFSGTLNTTLPFEVSCSVGGEQTKVQTKATVSNTEKILALCHLNQLYADPTTDKIIIRASPGTQGAITLKNLCSCNDDTGKSVLKNFVKITDTEFALTAEVDSNCAEPVCHCILECSYNIVGATTNNLSVSRKVKVLQPVLYITSSFEKLTLYKNTSTITAFTFPPSEDISCFANKVELSKDTFIVEDVNKDDQFTDMVLEKLHPGPGVYHVFPKNSAVTSGVYGIKCISGSSSASDTFLFEFDNSEASSIVGEKVDFDQYVSVLCSCDKTPSFCDARCCCDSDCSDVQKESFRSCIEGPAGGDHTIRVTPSCSDVSNVSPWERALCIKTSNSAFLGRYFNFVNKSFTAENDWEDSNIAGVPTSSSKSTKGYPIFIRSSLNKNTNGFLTLPGRIGGSCVSAQPLKLLDNSHAMCSRVVGANCNMEFGGVFSARSYLSPTETTVDPCEWFTRVYSNGVGSDDAIIKVLYKKNGDIINQLASQILQDQSCEHAVTDVEYEVAISSGVIISITATITIQDLRNKIGDTVTTSYSANYKSADLNSVTTKEISPEIGYNRHDSLLVSSGTFKLPQYGNCDDIPDTGNTPKFRVSTIVQCYKLVTDVATKQNCSALYDMLQTGYSEIIGSGAMIGSTPGNKSLIPVILIDPLNTTDLSETEMCDYLPSYLHIKIYHKNNTVSGEDITNVTFSVEHGSLTQLSGDKFLLQVDLQFLMSDVPTTRCSLCWEDITGFFENKQELLNGLIVVFAAVIYFAIPKNFLSSKL